MTQPQKTQNVGQALPLTRILRDKFQKHQLWEIQFKNSMEGIIAKIQEISNELANANKELEQKCFCLSQEKSELLTEVHQLRRRIDQMEKAGFNQTINLEQFIIDKKQAQNSLLFERMNESVESEFMMIDPDSANRSKTEYEYIQYISGQKKAQMSKDMKTPILHQPIFKEKLYRTSYSLKGLIRAFYSKTLSNPTCIIKLVDIINSDYKNNQYNTEGFLFEKYPDNAFMSDMMLHFLQQVDKAKNYCKILEQLNSYQLYDDILVQIYGSKLANYIEIPQQLNAESTKRCFFALAQIMGLNTEVNANAAYFYEECNRPIKSQNSESKYNVYEEISLNPRPKDSISCIPNEIREPLFTINIHQDECFQFLIKEEKHVDDVILNDSDLCISMSKSSRHPKAFESDSSIKQGIPFKRIHFFDVSSAFSRSPQQEYNKFLICQQSPDNKLKSQSKNSQQFMVKVKKNYVRFVGGGSTESMLLSQYNSNRASQDVEKQLFKSVKQRAHKSNNISARRDSQKYWKNSQNPSGVNSPRQRNAILEQSYDFEFN